MNQFSENKVVTQGDKKQSRNIPLVSKKNSYVNRLESVFSKDNKDGKTMINSKHVRSNNMTTIN